MIARCAFCSVPRLGKIRSCSLCSKDRIYYRRLRSGRAGLVLLAVAALLTTTYCGSARRFDRQLAAQVATERAIADAALASERARVAAIHEAR